MRHAPLILIAAAAITAAACADNDGRLLAGGEARHPSFAASHDTTGGASHYTANGRIAQVNWSNGGLDSITGAGNFEFGVLTAQDINGVHDEVVLVSYQLVRCAGFGCDLIEAGSGTL